MGRLKQNRSASVGAGATSSTGIVILETTPSLERLSQTDGNGTEVDLSLGIFQVENRFAEDRQSTKDYFCKV